MRVLVRDKNMTHLRKLAYTGVIPIRWGDLDALGHVNNTQYFRYMEQARIDWFDVLGLPIGIGQAAEEGPVIVNASCTFIRQLVYPGNVEVKTYIGEIGRSSVQTYMEIRPSYDADVVYAEGAAKVVWVNYALGKSMPLPEKIRELLLQEK